MQARWWHWPVVIATAGVGLAGLVAWDIVPLPVAVAEEEYVDVRTAGPWLENTFHLDVERCTEGVRKKTRFTFPAEARHACTKEGLRSVRELLARPVCAPPTGGPRRSELQRCRNTLFPDGVMYTDDCLEVARQLQAGGACRIASATFN